MEFHHRKALFRPVNSFKLFFESLLQIIQEKIPQKFWINIEELFLYEGIKIAMRLAPKTSMSDHWSNDIIRGTGVFGTPYVKMAMSLKRFKLIHKWYPQILSSTDVICYWLCSYSYLDVVSKEITLTELVKKANEIIRQFWSPYQNISLDDGFPQYEGKSIYRLRIERKCHQKGIFF